MKPEHFIDHEDNYKLFINTFISKVGKKAHKQLMRALTNPKNKFWEKLIFPNLIYDDCTGNPDPRIYIPISNNARTKGRNHLLAEKYSNSDIGIPQGDAHLFANSLAVGELYEDGNWDTPSSRTIGSHYTYITIEFDPDSKWSAKQKRDFLELQFSWFRIKGSNDLDCPIGNVHKYFSGKYSDYRGLTACYSGNKSVHIHLIFNTGNFFKQKESDRFNVRDGYKELHKNVRTTVETILNVGELSDSSLQLWEQYRKLPNGVLTVPDDDHILEAPKGTNIPLFTLWEKILSRAGRGANTALFNESLFYSGGTRLKKKSHRSPNKSKIGEMRPEEFDYCSEKFNSLVEKIVGTGLWPRGAGLEYQSLQNIGLLHACEGDETPNTVIFENSSKHFHRGGKPPDRDVDLKAPLSYFIRQWRKEYAKENGIDKPSNDDAIQVAPLTAMEQDFKDNAVDVASARRILADTVKSAFACEEPSVILGPEGCGKSTCAMREYPHAIETLVQTTWNSLMVRYSGNHLKEFLKKNTEEAFRRKKWLAKRTNGAFAFGSYQAAKEKEKEFNNMHAADNYIAYVLRSFSKEYAKCCSLEGLGCIDMEYAARHGYKSLIVVIKEQQPEVWNRMKTRHSKFQRKIAGSVPVWFMVHQTLHLWYQDGITSIYWHPDFFTAEYKDYWKLKQEMELQLVVQDEIRVGQLFSLAPSTNVDWYRDMQKDNDCWKLSNKNITEQYSAYCEHKESHPTDMGFQEVINIHKAAYTESDLITIRALENYGSNTDKCIYSKVLNNKWYAKIQYWMFGVATKTLILTTELLPTCMLEKIEYEGQALNIQRLHSRHLVRDVVEATLLKKCKSDDTNAVAEHIRETYGNDVVIISNHSSNIKNAITPASAMGTNRFSDKDTAQITHYKSPSEYETLQIINALFDLDSAVRLSHVDQFNQISGRTLGFRQDHDLPNKSYMFCSYSIWALIEDILRRHGRYKITVLDSAASRKDRKRNKNLKHTDQAKDGNAQTREIAIKYSLDSVFIAEAYRSTIEQSFMEQIIEGHEEMEEIAREYDPQIAL